jgi:RHS repeat-associated protein
VTDTRKFVWDGWRLLAALQQAGSQDIRRSAYTWGLDLAGQMAGGGLLPANLESAGTIGGLLAGHQYFGGGEDVVGVYCYDGNGNVTQLVDWSHDPNDPNGAIVAHYEYDPYGNVTAQTGVPLRFRFSTKFWDDETGLGYWGYRYYSPALGRWISRDPIGEAAGGNVYCFIRNQPVSSVDAHGLWGAGMHVGDWDGRRGTLGMARIAGMSRDCANILAQADEGVDTWTGSLFYPQYHFNFDFGGHRIAAGRDFWYRQWTDEGRRMLSQARCDDWATVRGGLNEIGRALHELQDGGSHQAGGGPSTEPGRGRGMRHMAETPFDHAPSWVCLLRLDPFGILTTDCIRARTTNPNWDNPSRPDNGDWFADDFEASEDDTFADIEAIMQYPAVNCACRGG